MKRKFEKKVGEIQSDFKPTSDLSE